MKTWRRIRSFLWRKSLRLRRTRYRAGTTKIMGSRFRYVDWPSFVYQYHDIFVREIYRLSQPMNVLTVLDCGVNVGLSMRYFLTRYPRASVYGWEADPVISRVAAKNLAMFSTKRYKLESQAVWIENGEVPFRSDRADTGAIVHRSSDSQTVRSVRLRDQIVLHEKIDLLKMDIEGAEFEVITDISPVLARVKHLFVELHVNAESSSKVPDILETLVGVGFSLRFEAVGSLGPAPFMSDRTRRGSDSQMNVFCSRL